MNIPHMKCQRRGFTMIEVLIVLAIVGILMIPVISNLTDLHNKTLARECQQNLRAIELAKASYVVHFAGSGDIDESNVTQKTALASYIKGDFTKIIKCPCNGAPYSNVYSLYSPASCPNNAPADGTITTYPFEIFSGEYENNGYHDLGTRTD